MNYTYYSTFISGLLEPVTKALSDYAPDAQIALSLDGLLVYRTSIEPKKIARLPFFNNSFYVIQYKKAETIQKVIKNIMNTHMEIPREIIGNKKSFRIIASVENQLIHLPKNDHVKIEDFFSQKLRLIIDRAKPDIEVWFLERSEGYTFCGIRLTKKPSSERYLQKGELRPELAWLLSFLSEPKKEDVCIDPFTGHGSIPLGRIEFPYKKFIASDNDSKKVEQLKIKVEEMKSDIEVQKYDATQLPFVDSSIDKIITDPPWGIYVEENVEGLYLQMLNEFKRIVKPDGTIIVLTAQKEMFEKMLKRYKEFGLTEKYNILVSGKKVGVYKIHKM